MVLKEAGALPRGSARDEGGQLPGARLQWGDTEI